jgi:mitochondrial fission protein ELM1
MTSASPRVWALIGQRTGDNNQVLALAEEIGLPFQTVALSYGRIAGYDLGRIRPEHLGATLLSLDRIARAQIKPPWPDLVIGVGRRSVPAARYIRKMSSGRTKLVRIGNPRVDPHLFDLVITTRQYEVPPSNNVLTLPVAMSRFRGPSNIGPSERSWLDSQPRPHLLLALGGNTKDVELPENEVVEAVTRLVSRAAGTQGTLLLASSPRTDPSLLRAIAPVLGQQGVMVPKDGPTFAALLGDADEIFVTADSVSMLSEAIVTGKPVGMIPVKLTEAGLRGVGERRKELFDFRSPKRDPRKFWGQLAELGLVGTVDAPRASPTDNPVKIAARAVRALLRDAP